MTTITNMQENRTTISKTVKRIAMLTLIGVLVLANIRSTVAAEPSPSTSSTTQQTSDAVALTQIDVEWQTYAYELDAYGSIVSHSFDPADIMTHTFKGWVLENEYLKVTLLPEFGGRVLSLIYKPTGHEQLYQNPVGTPYLIDTGTFYHDWLMIYGGIFPTFPEPEHGKAWFLPWDFEVIEETEQRITVAMSFVDDIDNPAASGQYNVGITGIECIFYVTLEAGRAAIDTQVVLHNPTASPARYEYWTNAGFAPGSEVGNPHTTADSEIIAPIDQVKMPPWWPDLLLQEQATDTSDVYTFTNLRDFVNWDDMGIAYAYPDMATQNYWGVINHTNSEGIFRVSDNIATPGLKIWTFGYDSVNVDPFADGEEWRRPFIELWAGVTPEFWQRAVLMPEDTLTIDATYGPTVGLSDIQHANNDFLINVTPAASENTIAVEVFTWQLDMPFDLLVLVDGEEQFAELITPNPQQGNVINVVLPSEDAEVEIVIVSSDGTEHRFAQ